MLCIRPNETFRLIDYAVGISGLSILVLAAISGIVALCRPDAMIKFQQAFYRKINWQITPIDYNKELRNTRIIGILCIVFSISMALVLFKTFWD